MEQAVEVYERCPDCEICGNEINPGREEYYRGKRVCSRCKKELDGDSRHLKRKQRSGSGDSKQENITRSRWYNVEPYKNVYTAEEYKRLEDLKEAAIQQVELYRGQLDEALTDVMKHGKTIKKLEEEKAMLLQQIERTVDEQKVELPREVAEAVSLCRSAGMSDLDIIKSLDVIPQLFRDYNSSVLNSLSVIHEYSKKLLCGDLLLQALVKGYNIEPEPRDKVKQFIEKWYGEPGDVTDAELYELADGIIDLLQTSS